MSTRRSSYRQKSEKPASQGFEKLKSRGLLVGKGMHHGFDTVVLPLLMTHHDRQSFGWTLLVVELLQTLTSVLGTSKHDP